MALLTFRLDLGLDPPLLALVSRVADVVTTFLPRLAQSLGSRTTQLEVKMSELSNKIANVDTKLDAEHEQVSAAIAELRDKIASLEGTVVTPEDLAALDALALKAEHVYDPPAE